MDHATIVNADHFLLCSACGFLKPHLVWPPSHPPTVTCCKHTATAPPGCSPAPMVPRLLMNRCIGTAPGGVAGVLVASCRWALSLPVTVHSLMKRATCSCCSHFTKRPHRRHAGAYPQMQQQAWRGNSSSCYSVARLGDSLQSVDTPSLLVDLDGEEAVGHCERWLQLCLVVACQNQRQQLMTHSLRLPALSHAQAAGAYALLLLVSGDNATRSV